MKLTRRLRLLLGIRNRLTVTPPDALGIVRSVVETGIWVRVPLPFRRSATLGFCFRSVLREAGLGL